MRSLISFAFLTYIPVILDQKKYTMKLDVTIAFFTPA